MKSINITLCILLSMFMFINSNLIPWKQFPKLTKQNSKLMNYGSSKKMHLPNCLSGNYMNQKRFLAPLMSYSKNKIRHQRKLMSRNLLMNSISKYMNKSKYENHIQKHLKKNKQAMKSWKMYRKNKCSSKSYKYPTQCGQYDYCCYWNTSKHMAYYLYRIYHYTSMKYNCQMSKMYLTRLGYKMISKHPYWYQMYQWKMIPRIIYSYKC
jgi:hypothetical protein